MRKTRHGTVRAARTALRGAARDATLRPTSIYISTVPPSTLAHALCAPEDVQSENCI